MSYNITSWRTTTLDNFKIHLSVLVDCDEISVELKKDNVVVATGLSEGFVISGVVCLHSGYVSVNDIHNSGEGSGWSWDIFGDILGKSTGRLSATVVWEGGDTIEKISVVDGAISTVTIE